MLELRIPVKQIAAMMLLSCICAPLQAQITKWVDENGKVHFGDRPPESVRGEAITIAPPKRQSSGTDARPLSQAERREKAGRLMQTLDARARNQNAEAERVRREEWEENQRIAKEAQRANRTYQQEAANKSAEALRKDFDSPNCAWNMSHPACRGVEMEVKKKGRSIEIREKKD